MRVCVVVYIGSPTGPEVAGFGAAGPNKQFLGFDRRENTKNGQVSRYLSYFRVSGKPINPPFFLVADILLAPYP